MTTQTRAEQLADAYEFVARANHYMVGIIEPCTADERDEAEQILIERQNALPDYRKQAWKRLEFALGIVANDINAQRSRRNGAA